MSTPKKEHPKWPVDAMGGRLPTGKYDYTKFHAYDYKDIEMMEKTTPQEKRVYENRKARVSKELRKYAFDKYTEVLRSAYYQLLEDLNLAYSIHSKAFPWLKDSLAIYEFSFRDDLSVLVAQCDLDKVYSYIDPKDKRDERFIRARRMDDVARLLKFAANRDAVRIVRESLPRSGIMVDTWENTMQITIRIRIEDIQKEFDDLKEEALEASLIHNHNDIELNLDKWKPGPHHVLFITGLSGSGKTTLAEKYEKEYNAKMFEIDGVDHGYDSSNTDLIKRLAYEIPEYNDYLLHRDDENLSMAKYRKAIWTAIEKAINIISKDQSRLWIIEGFQIFDAFDPNDLKDEPVIIKGTSVLTSALRAIKRDDTKGLLTQAWNRCKTNKALNKFEKSFT